MRGFRVDAPRRGALIFANLRHNMRFKTFFLILPLLALQFMGRLAAGGEGLSGFSELAFIKRNAFDPNHYYTEFINSSWRPGGGIFILNLKDGSQRELFPTMSGGVFGRFDISFDAKRIVFSYKKSAGEGFRIYSAKIDGSGLKQLTFPEPSEAETAKKFKRGGYHSGTDDMDPCWLPDGGIAFVSTRPRYGVLCDPSDDLTVATMYRMEADGSGMKRLSYGALSENSPCVLPDGRIMYTRWEYVDKGASAVKCLWAMRPDGTGSSEIYGNDIALPVTMIFGRPMPGGRGKYVFIGAPHYPQGPNGTVITADTSKGTRSESAMRHITPDVEIRDESGYHFKKGGNWKFDPSGKSGRLFRDPYPISDGEFLVAMKPEGYAWNDAGGYELALLSPDGSARRIYRDEKYSAFQPVPIAPRPLPPVLPSAPDEGLERRNLAALLITDVYAGLENVPRGAAKYVRVLEQVARPWGANRIAMGGEKTEDAHGQQHAAVSRYTHLGLKVQRGVAEIEPDGSAYFLVPANRNIFLQVLDENYMALQTERTFVNYMPGEIRGCIGCHEGSSETPQLAKSARVLALRKPPQKLKPQRGEASAEKLFDYAAQIQPIFDGRCVSCHGQNRREKGLDLRGTPTKFFSVSYESLVPDYVWHAGLPKECAFERERVGMTNMSKKDYARLDRRLLGKIISEIFQKDNNVEYLPAGSLGARTSVLIGAFAPEAADIRDARDAARARELAKIHKNIRLSDAEILALSNWIDANCQFHPSYWGAKNLKYKNAPQFRPKLGFDEAISETPPKGLEFSPARTVKLK